MKINDPKLKKLFKNKTILITGGTGSFGKACTKILLKNFNLKKILIYSRDELKQYEMAKEFNQDNIRFLIGDVRDEDRLDFAIQKNIDVVIHAAAMKQVPATEYNPFEAVKTNVFGAQNIIDAALNNGVEKRLVNLGSPINIIIMQFLLLLLL